MKNQQELDQWVERILESSNEKSTEEAWVEFSDLFETDHESRIYVHGKVGKHLHSQITKGNK